MKKRQLVQIMVSNILLHSWLKFPDAAVIVDVGQTFQDSCTNSFRILVEHPDFPEVEEGVAPSEAMPVYTEDENGDIVMMEWGLIE